MSLFTGSKISDQLMIVEIENKAPNALSERDFNKALEEGNVKDGTFVTKVSILEKYTVVVVKQLQKINGGTPSKEA